MERRARHDEFNKKYTKGFVLFVVLLFYESAVVLNYLVFDRKKSKSGQDQAAPAFETRVGDWRFCLPGTVRNADTSA